MTHFTIRISSIQSSTIWKVEQHYFIPIQVRGGLNQKLVDLTDGSLRCACSNVFGFVQNVLSPISNTVSGSLYMSVSPTVGAWGIA